MTILNDVEKIRAVDPDNMYNRIFDLPEQMEDALTIAQKWKINADDFSEIKNIVLIGMGGSAIGGDLVRTFLADKLLVPFQIIRHYELPEYVDDESLVIVSSYSGNTEETLAAFEDALNRKAMIAAVTTGGMLKEIADVNDIPIAEIPEGIQPRAAVGYSFIPILLFFEKIGLIKNTVSEIETVIKHLKNSRDNFIEDLDIDKNPAKKLAEKISGKIPIIYGGPSLTDVVANRWKGQICENAKNLAFANTYAEFNHNELVGWVKTNKFYKKYLIVIQLRDSSDHDRIKKRMDIVGNIIADLNMNIINIHSEGATPLARMFYLIQYGDFVSYYLAVLNNADPSPVKVIMKLKKLLEES